MTDAAPLPPAKNKGRGCLIALAVAFGLVVLVAGSAAFVAWRFMKTDKGRAIGDAVGAGFSGLRMPGAAEIRKAFGCQAAVLDPEAFRKLAKAFDDKAEKTAPEGNKVVLCRVPWAGSPPSCDAVADVYRRAVGAAAGSFTVSVTLDAKGAGACEKRYTAEPPPPPASP